VGNPKDIIGQLVATVHELTDAVKSQDAEVRELRGRLDALRRAIG